MSSIQGTSKMFGQSLERVIHTKTTTKCILMYINAGPQTVFEEQRNDKLISVPVYSAPI